MKIEEKKNYLLRDSLKIWKKLRGWIWLSKADDFPPMVGVEGEVRVWFEKIECFGPFYIHWLLSTVVDSCFDSSFNIASQVTLYLTLQGWVIDNCFHSMFSSPSLLKGLLVYFLNIFKKFENIENWKKNKNFDTSWCIKV